MSAPFRLDAWTFSSAAFDVLGDVAGYNAHEARGRWARAGSEATVRQTYVFSEAAIRGLFGPRGAEALLAAELAERVEEGGLRLLRMEGSIEWYSDVTSKRQSAGRKRAANAHRDALGRMLSTKKPSTEPARAGVLDQHESSTAPPPTSSLPPDLIPEIPEIHTRARERHPAVGGIARRTWDHGAKLRAELIASNVQAPPWPLNVGPEHSAWVALLDRIGELLVDSTAEDAERVCRNRVDVAYAKVRADGDGNWFAATVMFKRNSFEAFAYLSPEQFTRKPARAHERGDGFAAILALAQEDS